MTLIQNFYHCMCQCFNIVFSCLCVSFSGAANVCNIFLMRQNELREGIDVEDENGNVIGSSKVAAWKVFDTCNITLFLNVRTTAYSLTVRES